MMGQTVESSHSVRHGSSRNAVCLCTDRNMLIPALFVANAVRSHGAASHNPFDVIVFAEPPEVEDVHRRWLEQKGILLCEDMDLSRQAGVGKFSGRLTAATLMKLSLAGHLAGRYDKILYLDADFDVGVETWHSNDDLGVWDLASLLPCGSRLQL